MNNENITMTNTEFWSLQSQRDAALERAEKAEGFIAEHVIDCFTRYVPLNNVFQCRVCEKYDNRALHRENVAHEEDCRLVAIIATTPAPLPTEERAP